MKCCRSHWLRRRSSNRRGQGNNRRRRRRKRGSEGDRECVSPFELPALPKDDWAGGIMNTLRDKVVLITGASSGFGAAAARLFAQEGCRLVLAARRRQRLAEVADEVRALGGEALPVPVDVTQHDQIEAMVKAAVDEYGRLD